MHFKVKIDQNATQGDNELDLYYSTSGSSSVNNVWTLQPFNISVANSQTDFDLVVQDYTSSATSIAIANTGENTANSLIVRIPTQSNFKVSGATGQIVGNLNSGDYTIATFDLTAATRNNNGTLAIELDYTDAIGVRRTIIKDISLSSFLSNSSYPISGLDTLGSGSGNNSSGGSFPTGFQGQFSRGVQKDNYKYI